MANGPTTLALPPFTGATRRLILLNLAVFFALALLSLVLPTRFYTGFYSYLILLPPSLFHGQLWQLVTYSFLPLGILGTAFAMLTLWFTGSILESTYSPRWLMELYFTSAIGGGLLAALLTLTHFRGLTPDRLAGIGPYPALYGLLIAVAILFGDLEFFLFFILRIKARYMVAIYVLIDLAILLKADEFSQALLQLCGALAGYVYLRLVPRRGLSYAVTERYFAARNEFYRSKRRRAARKFEVYMGKQGRDVRFDKNGRYIDPDEHKDPTDKRWMN